MLRSDGIKLGIRSTARMHWQCSLLEPIQKAGNASPVSARKFPQYRPIPIRFSIASLHSCVRPFFQRILSNQNLTLLHSHLAMVNTFLGALTVLALTKGLSAAAIINPADAYFTVTCQTGSILDTGASPSGRWADAKADLAFEAAARNWNEVPGSQGSSVSLNFVNSMLRLWGQGDTVNCGLVEGSCDYSALQCGDDTAKGDTPFPGAWEILKSLSHLHAVSYATLDSDP